MKSLNEYINENVRVYEAIDVADEQVIDQWIQDHYKTRSYRINPKTHTVDGEDVYAQDTLTDRLMPEGWSWGKVKGNFSCGSSKTLKSLEGSPKEVWGTFFCNLCVLLKDLNGAPEKVGGDFWCQWCDELISLEGAPEEVGGDFDCVWCAKLKTLKGSPKRVGKNFECDHCRSLKSLEGAPEVVGGILSCHDCKSLKTLNGAPEGIKIEGEARLLDPSGIKTSLTNILTYQDKITPKIGRYTFKSIMGRDVDDEYLSGGWDDDAFNACMVAAWDTIVNFATEAKEDDFSGIDNNMEDLFDELVETLQETLSDYGVDGEDYEDYYGNVNLCISKLFKKITKLPLGIEQYMPSKG